MKEDITSKLIDYIDGRLSPRDRQQLEKEIEQSSDLQREVKELRRLMQLMEETPMEDPGQRSRQRFYDALSRAHSSADQPADNSFRLIRFWRSEWGVAAAIALLIMGIGLGVLWQKNQWQQEQIAGLQSEVQQTRRMMFMSMLEQPSASTRIQAINRAPSQMGADQEIVTALAERLNFDDNVNVRLKAAEALAKFADQPGVTALLIRSMENQDRPEVQIALIEILTRLGAKEAVGEFHKLMERDTVMEVVRHTAAYGIGQLM
ncbi:MAG: HEAT repeat domain-containing protein [Saprospiraceae bacterium]|nr:HEAT repeat domain-containing protein [Saprospiraceae bacterium]